MRWLLLDEVVSIDKGVRALTKSKVPAATYSAELLMIEMMAQTGGLLVGAEADYANDVVFAKIESATFIGSAKPHQLLSIEASSENLRAEGAWIDGVVKVGEEVIGKARFFLISVGKLVPESKNSITFHSEFMNYFDVRNKLNLAAS